MDPRDNSIQNREKGWGKIVLTWRVSAFIELPPGKETIQETLHSDAFRTDADSRSYWSVPERLVDMRWLSDRRRETTGEAEETGFALYMELEYRLYRMVTTLGEWAGGCGKSIEKLRESRDAQDDVLLNQWRPEMPFLLKGFSDAEEGAGPVFSAKDLDRLYGMAGEFSQIHVTDARKRNLQRSAQKLQQNLQKTYGTGLEQQLSLGLFSAEELRVTFALAKDFCKKAYDFLDNQAWREENPEIRKLRELEEHIQKVRSDWRPEGEDRWSEQYQRSLWTGLQLLADDACSAVNGTRDGRTASIKELLQRVDDAIQSLQISPKRKTILHDQYIKDSSRCVALLDIRKGPRVMAFSGFWDCEDPQTQRALGCTASAAEAFREISRRLNVELAIFSTGVVDRIIRCKIGKSLRMEEYGPMRRELPPAFEKAKAGVVKSGYSCCERKILAEIAARGGVGASAAAALYVKFQPCLSCYGALTNWTHTNGIQLTVDYPEI